GLRKYMPITSACFLIGTLAICGIPPFAGFWSKDEILGLAFQANPALWLVGFGTAGLTAFYMFRMYFMTFEGPFRGNDQALHQKVFDFYGLAPTEKDNDDHGHGHSPHESPIAMTLPLMALAIPSILIGLIGRPWANQFEAFIHAPGEVIESVTEFDWSEFYVMAGSSIGIGLIGISFAILMYLQHKIDPAAIAEKYPALYRFSLNKWYFDDLYDSLFVQGSRRLARQIMEIDYKVIDGAVNFTGLVTLVSGEGLKYLENGRAQFYALIVFAAVLGFVIIFSVV
ncbi:MAG: proton-conducting transporter membrane subunit, partial [Microcystaceae cyanobacterium]